MPPLPFSLSVIALTKSIVWVLFAFVCAIWLIATVVLEFHWKNYATDKQKIAAIRFIYRTGSYFLLTIIFLAAVWY